MMNKGRTLLTRASTVALLAAANPLAVQSAWAEAPDSSGDIIVTASRRQTTALSTPIDISAIAGTDLAKNGIANFQDLSQSVAGLVYNSTGIRDGGASSFIIHGLNLDSVSSGGDSPLATVAPVSVYLDETPAFVNVHLADIQRIEVLRGPQATLYGNASIAGTVRVLFNEPDPAHFTADASGDVGWTHHASGPNYGFDGAVNVPLASNLALRVASGYTFAHGFIDAPALMAVNSQGKPILADPSDVVHSLPVRTSAKDVDDSELSYVRAMLKYEQGPLKLLATYQHQYEHSEGPDEDSYPGNAGPSAYSSSGDVGASPAFQNDNFDKVFPTKFGKYESGEFMLRPMTRNVDLGSLEASYNFGFATLTSVTSGYAEESHAIDDNSASYEKSLGWIYQGYPRMLVPSHRTDTENAVIQELRLVSSTDKPLTYTVGAFFMHQYSRWVQEDDMEGYTQYLDALGGYNTGTDVGYIYDRRMTFTDMAVFGELAWHVTPAWQITGGVRGYRQKLDITALNELPVCGSYCSEDYTNPLGLVLGSETQTNTRALFKFNSSYNFSTHTLLYFTFSQGERRGGASATPTKGPYAEDPAFQYYRPDSVNNFEVGFKSRLGRSFEFSSAVYYVDWHDPQVSVSTPNGGFPATVNGSAARSLGVDLEGHLLVSKDFKLNATYGYNDSKLTGPIVVGGTDYGGNGQRLPGTPHHTASVSADYDHELSDGLMFDARANVSYRSGMPTSLTPSANVDLPGFAMVGTSFGVSRDLWRISLYGENLANNRGVLSAQSLQKVDVRGVNNRLSRPRTFGLRFALKYR